MPTTAPTRGRASIPAATWNNHFHLQSPFRGREGFGMPMRAATPTRSGSAHRSSTPGRRMTVSGIPVRGPIDHRVNSQRKMELLQQATTVDVHVTEHSTPASTPPPAERSAIHVDPAGDVAMEDAAPADEIPVFRGFDDDDGDEAAAAAEVAPSQPRTEAQATNLFTMPTSELITRYHTARKSIASDFGSAAEPQAVALPPTAPAVTAAVDARVADAEPTLPRTATDIEELEVALTPASDHASPEGGMAPAPEPTPAPIAHEEAVCEPVVAAVEPEAPKTVEKSMRKSVSFRSPLTDMKDSSRHSTGAVSEDASSCTSLTLSPEMVRCTRKRLSYSLVDTPTDEDAGDNDSESDSVGWTRGSSTGRRQSMGCESIISFEPLNAPEHPKDVTQHVPTPCKVPDHRETIVLENSCSSLPLEEAAAAEEGDVEMVVDEDDAAEAASEAGTVDITKATSPSQLTYRDLQAIALELNVPNRNAKRTVLEAAVRKALFADGEAEKEEEEKEEVEQAPPAAATEPVVTDLQEMSYRDLQLRAKELGVSAAGPRVKLLSRVRMAERQQ